MNTELDRFEIEDILEETREMIELSSHERKEQFMIELNEMFDFYESFNWDMLEHYRNVVFSDDDEIAEAAEMMINKLESQWEDEFPIERLEEIKEYLKED